MRKPTVKLKNMKTLTFITVLLFSCILLSDVLQRTEANRLKRLLKLLPFLFRRSRLYFLPLPIPIPLAIETSHYQEPKGYKEIPLMSYGHMAGYSGIPAYVH
ncbi:uncharacterized protein LOC143239867 [Tachypleus tridentatus]|uniref:uncharacterized protein LOC143239867 n=1 Tax=Tachypleus tridentatus TaxID=6853 RepID=UPI003FD423EA